MMNKRERDALYQIERGIELEDPGFATLMRRSWPAPIPGRRLDGYETVVLVLVLLAGLFFGLSAASATGTPALHPRSLGQEAAPDDSRSAPRSGCSTRGAAPSVSSAVVITSGHASDAADTCARMAR